MKPAVPVFVLLMLLLVHPYDLAANPLRDSLKNASGVVVRFDGVEHFFTAHRFDPQQLRRRLESGLQAAGIRILGAAAARQDPDALVLTVRFHVNPNAWYLSFLVYLKLQSKTALPGQRGFIHEELWSDWKHGMTEHEHLDRLNPYIMELFDKLMLEALGYVPAQR